jgi:hypothetical protein
MNTIITRLGRRIAPVGLTLLIVGIVGESRGQAELSPYLSDQMEKAAATGGMVRALVVLRDQVDLVSMDQELVTEKATVQQRATRVITALQEKAVSTQHNLLAFLSTRPSD